MSRVLGIFVVKFLGGYKNDFSNTSKTLRKEKGLSQVQLAEALNISKACISMIEIGKNEPTANTLLKYADFFQCSTDYLLGREDDFGNITIHTEKPAPLPPDTQELVNIYQALSPAHRSQILEYARYFAEKSGAASTRRKA